MGCIVRDFDYQEPVNVPPSVLGTVDSPMDVIHQVKILQAVGGDAGVSADLQFVATVRDPNVGEQLTALVFVDRNMHPTPIRTEFPIVPEQDDDPWDRRVSFTVPRATFATEGCHSVELHVSHAFVDFSNPRPATDGDLGVGVWWIAAYSDMSDRVDMLTCPQTTD